MKWISLLAAALLVSAAAPSVHAPTVWSVDHAHSALGFKVRHLGISNVRGNFKEYEASVTIEDDDISSLIAEATIQTVSIFTDNDRRDNHLRSPDFFEAETYPEIRFVSSGVHSVEGNMFELVGDLTIRDVTREVVLNAEYLGRASMGDQERAGFVASLVIDRMDYGLAWNMLTEAGGFVVGHDVEITIELELVKAASP